MLLVGGGPCRGHPGGQLPARENLQSWGVSTAPLGGPHPRSFSTQKVGPASGSPCARDTESQEERHFRLLSPSPSDGDGEACCQTQPVRHPHTHTPVPGEGHFRAGACPPAFQEKGARSSRTSVISSLAVQMEGWTQNSSHLLRPQLHSPDCSLPGRGAPARSAQPIRNVLNVSLSMPTTPSAQIGGWRVSSPRSSPQTGTLPSLTEPGCVRSP